MPKPEAKNNRRALYHDLNLGWSELFDKLGYIERWKVQHADPGVALQLEQYTIDYPNLLIPGIANYPSGYWKYHQIAGDTRSKWIPDMFHGGVAFGVTQVLAAAFGIETEANGLQSHLGGTIRGNLYAYSGGNQSGFAALHSGALKVEGDFHSFGRVLFMGDLQSLSSTAVGGQIYVHRGYADWVGWLGYLNLKFEDIPDGHGGTVAGFTITVQFGTEGRVTYLNYNYDHEQMRMKIKSMLDEME